MKVVVVWLAIVKSHAYMYSFVIWFGAPGEVVPAGRDCGLSPCTLLRPLPHAGETLFSGQSLHLSDGKFVLTRFTDCLPRLAIRVFILKPLNAGPRQESPGHCIDRRVHPP